MYAEKRLNLKKYQKPEKCGLGYFAIPEGKK